MKETIRVRVKVAGFVNMKMITAEFDLDAPKGVSLKKLFGLADKSPHLSGGPLRRILNMARPPTVLVDGRAVDMPQGLSMKILEPAEVAIMTPLGGG